MAYDSTIFNTDPYYDDFDQNKKFLRMMFRPGYAVQARELTQLQSIVQNQIEKFGNNIFSDGSMVLNGQIFENYIKYARVTSISGTSSITDFIGTEINSSGYAPATIIHAETGLSAGDTNSVLFFKYTSGANAYTLGTVLGATSSSNARITATITGNFAVSGVTASALGDCVLVSVDEGVRYVDGFFVSHDAQKIAACSTTGTSTPVRLFDNPTCSIGFLKNKTFVTAQDDSSLNDPAYGYYNYAAPGTDRYKINLVLNRNNFYPNSAGSTSAATDNFARSDYIEFIRLNGGYTTKKEMYPDYAVIEDTLARRTYDESGNYTVRAFDLNLENGNTASTIGAVIGSGKAYVFGYEFETQAPTTLQINKARDTIVQPSTQFNSTLGYFTGGTMGANTNLSGFDISTMPTVLLSSSSATAAFSQVGSARVRGIERTTATNSNFYMFDVGMSAGATFGSVKTAFIPGVTGAGQQLFNFTQVGGKTTLQGTDSLLWEVPFGKAVKTINDVDYSFTTHFTPVAITNSYGSVDLQTKTGLYVVNQTMLPAAAAPLGFPEAAVRVYGMSGQELNGTYISSGITMGLSFTTAYTGNAYALISTSADYAVGVGYKKRTKTFTKEVIAITGGSSFLWQNWRTDIGSQPYFFLSNKQLSPNVDIIRVTAITGTYAGTANTNLNSYFTLDSGQRDTHYDWSRLVLASGYTASSIGTSGITGPFYVTVEKFVHSVEYGPFTVDSYITGSSFGYENIPSYTSPKTGTKYELRDVIDFRPARIGGIPASSTTSITGSFYSSLMSIPSGLNKFSYTSHLPRTDKLVLSRDKNFSIITGISDSLGSVPQDNPDAMTLYTITLNPYTFSSTDVSYRYNNNRRYTMKDVADLEKRLDSVEYYTTLNILEQEAKNLQILDDITQLSIPKKGILVDTFRGHNIGDIQDANYNASIDYEKTELRPAFINRVYRLGLTSSGSSTTTINGMAGITADFTATISYTLSPQIAQPIATKSITVNPSGVSNYLGLMKTYPSADFWYNDTLNPIVRINVNGENDNWESISARSATAAGFGGGFGTQYNDWESNWVGRNRLDETSVYLNNKVPSRNIDAKTNGVNVSNSNSNMLPESLRSSGETVTENKVIRRDILPYARNIVVALTAEGLKPNTKMYGFFDGKSLSSRLYEMSSAGVLGNQVSSMTADSYGKLTPSSGGFYAFKLNPGTDPLITTGSKLLRVTDSSSDTKLSTTTAADQVFYIQGEYGTKSNDMSSTRNPLVRRESVSSDDVITNVFSKENQRSGLVQLKGMIDPLSQTFLVDPAQYPSGIMIKQLGLFFKSKPLSTSPISVIIKPTVNSYPHPSKVLPFATSTLYPTEVNVSDNGVNGTNPETVFSFSSPVYLLPGKQYSFSVLTNDAGYSLFTSELGGSVLSDETKIASKQKSAVSMFKAQNSSTLMKIDNEDIKFVLYACDFSSSGSGTVGLVNGLDTSAIYGSSITIDEMRVNVPFLTPPGTSLYFTETSSTLLTSGSISNEKNMVLPTRKTSVNPSTAFFKATANLSTTNRWVSPILDLDRGNLYAIENIVSATPTTETFTNVVDYGNSRYITKRITLAQAATNVGIYLSLSNPYPSTIDVYYRYLPTSDSSIIFDNQDYIKMTKTYGSDHTQSNQYREVQYGATGSASFTTFAVKIVFKSSDGTNIPTIQNMRIVAT